MDTLSSQPKPGDEEVAKPRPQVILMRGVVGSRKTQDLIEGLSSVQRRRLLDGKMGQVVGSTPRHDLNDEVANRWKDASGLVAATIVGRTAKDPRHAPPGKADPNWCRYIELVETATDHGKSVKETCCDGCDHLLDCGFMAQFEAARAADLVLMPHALMPHQQDELGKPHSVFIDEDFLDALIFEMPKPKSSFRFEVDELLMEDNAASKFNFDFPKLQWSRREAHECLQRQIRAGELGGVQKKFFTEEGSDGVIGLILGARECGMARRLEFKLSPQLEELQPNLKGRQLEDCKKRNAKKFLQRARHMFMTQVWDALRNVLERDDVEVSGRVFLYEDKNSGRICIGVRGLRPIVQQWLPKQIFVASATMPPVEIISHAFPNCDIIPDDLFDVELPAHTKVVQVINAPASKGRTSKKSNQEALRRYIMERALECGMPSTLVGVQEQVEKAFETMKPPLPSSIEVRHFNAVAGLNGFEHVGLMISIGRAAPGPLEIENQIAAITGRDPPRLPEKKWFTKAKGIIKLRDGRKVKVDCCMHPDPLVEAWRRHKHTSCVIQMIGRARPYNRTADYPLIIYVLCNEPLGIAVDEVLDWEKVELEPLALVEPMNCDGFIALAPEALRTLWPSPFESERTAKRELKKLRDKGKAARRIQAILTNGKWRRFTFQKPGARQKRREGYYDVGRFGCVEDLRSVLEGALGADLRLEEG